MVLLTNFLSKVNIHGSVRGPPISRTSAMLPLTEIRGFFYIIPVGSKIFWNIAQIQYARIIIILMHTESQK